MGIRKTFVNPGTPAAAAYWPFKVQSLGADFVSVNPGELFYDPTLGGELIDIKGINVPFRVNEKSFIYLQVFFDLSGRPTHAGIAHTGTHLQWLMPGERWLGYPRLYVQDLMPYYGIAAWDDHAPIGTPAGGSQIQSGGVVDPGLPGIRPPKWTPGRQIAEEGWFHHSRKAGEGGAHLGQPAVTHVPGHMLAYPDSEWTVDVVSHLNPTLPGVRIFTQDQIYTGIDRELRKDICAQGLNLTTPNFNLMPLDRKDVGWYPEPTLNPLPHVYRRQKLGNVKLVGGVLVPDGTEGVGEVGGYMNIARNDVPGLVPGGSQALRYRLTYHKIVKRWAEDGIGGQGGTMKFQKTYMDQVMAIYPIAFAINPTRPLDKGFSAGIFVKGDRSMDRKEFTLVQAAKTNLRLVTVIEGDHRFKIMQPYTGMHNTSLVGDGSGGMDWLNFVQKWDYHAGGGSIVGNEKREDGSVILGDARYLPGGSHYYARLGKPWELPYTQNYVNRMFNNQRPT